jgi:hypothetical protein
MLTLNFSDKGVGNSGQPAMVTGRFGLGFKTVFFVSNEPEVVSGRLAFEIRGGFYPLPLELERAQELRAQAEALGGPGLVPTAIRLKWADGTKEESLLKAVGEFSRIAPLLIIFSRRIRTVIVNCGGEVTTIGINQRSLTSSGRVVHFQIGNAGYLCFRCQIRGDQRPASILLQVDAGGVAALKDNIPKLWITTPTAEHSDFRWALNGPFKPDAGRQRLALNNPANRHIGEEIAHAWAMALIEVFDATTSQWDSFAERLGLHSSASFKAFWLQLWNEMTRSSPVLHWEALRDGGQVLGWISWGHVIGAMRLLVQQRAAIPTKLPGAYGQMVQSADVHFCASGLLAQTANRCFEEIAEWDSVKALYPPGQTVCAEVASFLKDVGCCENFRGDLTLQKALAAELGAGREANHLVAERIGALLQNCQALFESSSTYSVEVQPLLIWLKEAKLLAVDDKYYPGTQLICTRILNGLIEKDEPLRAAFAPDSAVLSKGYSDTALRFFVKARGQLTANAVILADWVRGSLPTQLSSVLRYLIDGELGQQLADQLGRSWLDTKRSTAAFQKLSPGEQSELERKFFRGQIWTQPFHLSVPPFAEPPVVQVMPAEEAFCRVSDWWRREGSTWVARYESKTYTVGFPGSLPWSGDDEWEIAAQPSAQSRWLVLFIHAALVPLGFNRIGRDQSFTQFLVSKNWLDVFARVSDDPGALLAALDNYLNASIQNTQFHFPMRQFIAFYAVARNLESFLYSLRSAEESKQPDSFTRVFSPNANPGLTGTGITAPPLSGMLGMGTCQLLRELYRLGRLRNPNGYRFAFTPIRKVRRLCTQLFGITDGLAGASASEAIFAALGELGSSSGLDPTFNHSFDLPFQILAENKDLRTAVLHREFEAEAMDSPELDAAPPDFNR